MVRKTIADSSSSEEMKLCAGNTHLFSCSRKITDEGLHLIFSVCEMEILVQRMIILVKEKPIFMHLCKGGKKVENRNLQTAKCFVGFQFVCFSGKE